MLRLRGAFERHAARRQRIALQREGVHHAATGCSAGPHLTRRARLSRRDGDMRAGRAFGGGRVFS